MNYYEFYIDKLPFTPKEDLVIYFNPSAMALKETSLTLCFIDENYSQIKGMFNAAGLDFCFLPAIFRELKIKELLEYFHPEVKDVTSLHFGYDNYYTCFSDCLVESSNIFSQKRSGLIRYSGYKNDNKYIFHFTPICTDHDLGASPLSELNKGVMGQIENYILANRVEFQQPCND